MFGLLTTDAGHETAKLSLCTLCDPSPINQLLRHSTATQDLVQRAAIVTRQELMMCSSLHSTRFVEYQGRCHQELSTSRSGESIQSGIEPSVVGKDTASKIEWRGGIRGFRTDYPPGQESLRSTAIDFLHLEMRKFLRPGCSAFEVAPAGASQLPVRCWCCHRGLWHPFGTSQYGVGRKFSTRKRWSV